MLKQQQDLNSLKYLREKHEYKRSGCTEENTEYADAIPGVHVDWQRKHDHWHSNRTDYEDIVDANSNVLWVVETGEWDISCFPCEEHTKEHQQCLTGSHPSEPFAIMQGCALVGKVYLVYGFVFLWIKKTLIRKLVEIYLNSIVDLQKCFAVSKFYL